MSAKISSFPGTSGRSADLLLEKLQDPKVAESLVSLLEKSQVLNDFLERSEGMLNSITKGVGDLGRVGVATLSETFKSVELDDLKAAGGHLQAMIPAVRDLMREHRLARRVRFLRSRSDQDSSGERLGPWPQLPETLMRIPMTPMGFSA